MSFIQTETYKQIIEVLPILCVDVVIKSGQGKYLLVKRENEPKRGHWWVIGGRVLKGETCEEAAFRKIREEVSLNAKAVYPIGFFELVTGVHPFGLELQYHAVSIVYETLIDDSQEVKLDSQSVAWIYASELPEDFNIKYFNACELVKK